MTEILNLEEAKELVKKYRSITPDKIEKHFKGHGIMAMNKMTGFGVPSTCMLCKNIDIVDNDYDDVSCIGCIYTVITGDMCDSGENRNTYVGIAKAGTRHLLFEAKEARANHLETLIKRHEHNS